MDENEPEFMKAMPSDLSYLLNWTQPMPPPHVLEMSTDQLLINLRTGLHEAAQKIDDLAQLRGNEGLAHPELSFLSQALKRVSGSQSVKESALPALPPYDIDSTATELWYDVPPKDN